MRICKSDCLALLIILLILPGAALANGDNVRPTRQQIAERRANSVLAKLSDTLTPGTWAQLPIVPFTQHDYVYNDSVYKLNLLESPPPSTGLDILGWSDDSHWDSLTGQYFHMGLRKTRKFICYSEETNGWRVIDLPLNHDSAQSPHIAAYWGHICGNNAFDIENSRFYHHAHSSNALPNGIDSGAFYAQRICYFDAVTERWTKLPEAPPLAKESSIEYFSAMKGLVCLVQGTNGGTCHFFSDSTQTWRKLGDSLPVCGYISTARHNPFREEVLIAGGNYSYQVVMRIKKDGTFERLADLPLQFHLNSDKITVDPVSGRYLIRISVDGTYTPRFFEFDSDRNEYREIPHPPRAREGGIWGTYDMPTCAFIPEYKVTLWTYGNTVHVYKHDTLNAVLKEKATGTMVANLSLSIYPNPANATIRFDYTGSVENVLLDIFDITGKNIESVPLSKIGISTIRRNYPNGIYFASLKPLNGTGRNKVTRFSVVR